MNKKGFTLIELLAVIIILSIVLVIIIPTSFGGYKRTKLKAEETFVKRLSQVVDSYTTLNIDSINFSSIGEQKIKREGENRVVKVYQANITVQDLIDNKIITTNDYVNPNNKDVTCNNNAEIEIYKDSDFVYCHKIKASELDCLTEEYKNSLMDSFNSEEIITENNLYVVDTCVWENIR